MMTFEGLDKMDWATARPLIAPVVLSKTGGRCYYCGCELGKSFDVDHVTPKSRGGTQKLSNLVPSCRECNSEKGSMTIDEWRSHKGRKALSRKEKIPHFTQFQRLWLQSKGIDIYASAPRHIFWFECTAANDNGYKPLLRVG